MFDVQDPASQSGEIRGGLHRECEFIAPYSAESFNGPEVVIYVGPCALILARCPHNRTPLLPAHERSEERLEVAAPVILLLCCLKLCSINHILDSIMLYAFELGSLTW
jgi:hypothetical protein